MAGFPNPFQENRPKSKGEIEVEQGSFLLMAFRLLKISMPTKTDSAAVERTGQMLQRRFPWIAKITPLLVKRTK